MVILNREGTEKIEPPQKIDFHRVIYWEPTSQQLLSQKEDGDTESATLLTKSKKFLEFDCIQDAGNGKFKILPIAGYKKTAYLIEDTDSGFKCNCQGFNSNKFCSHVLAVTQFIFIREWNSK